jgi:mannosyl-3-phosphoglycerate phosphatase
MKKLIVFTDLDGTLLDFLTYSFEKALPALQFLKEKNIPLIICSSKTRKEIEYYRKKLGNDHPFISENGGGIFIPKDYFSLRTHSLDFKISNENGYQVIRLGEPYNVLRKAIRVLREEGFKVKGFGDMTIKELTEIANMNINEAEMAKERDFDEPFIFEGNKEEIQKLFKAIRSKGFNFTQGRFFHILGNSDKGKAAAILIKLYKKEFGEVITTAIGDSLNDVSMLERVDYPIIVQKPDGTHDQRIDLPKLIKARGIGPDGWNNAVFTLTSHIH